MRQRHAPRVQRLPADQAHIAAVEAIARNRPASRGQVDPNLMRPPRDELAAHQCHRGRRRQHLVASLARRPGRCGHYAPPIRRVARQRQRDPAGGRRRRGGDHREVLLTNLAGCGVPLHRRVRAGGKRDDDQPRRVLVEPGQDAGLHSGSVAEMPEQSVEHRARGLLVGGVHDNAGRLVDDDHVVVLIADVERGRLGRRRRASRC